MNWDKDVYLNGVITAGKRRGNLTLFGNMFLPRVSLLKKNKKKTGVVVRIGDFVQCHVA